MGPEGSLVCSTSLGHGPIVSAPWQGPSRYHNSHSLVKFIKKTAKIAHPVSFENIHLRISTIPNFFKNEIVSISTLQR